MNSRVTTYAVLAILSLLYFLLMAGTFNSLDMVLPAMVKDFGMNWAQAGFGFTHLGRIGKDKTAPVAKATATNQTTGNQIKAA